MLTVYQLTSTIANHVARIATHVATYAQQLAHRHTVIDASIDASHKPPHPSRDARGDFRFN